MAVLQRTAGMLGPVRSRRKAILYVGEGIDYDLGEQTVALAQTVSTFLSAVSRSNIVMYTLDPGGMRAPELGVDRPSDGDFVRALDDAGARAYTALRAWVDDSGGVSAVNTNDIDRGLASIVADTSRYYVLGYDSPVESDGRFHRIEVRPSRAGVTVRSRRGFFASARPATADAAAPAAGRGPTALTEALASPIPAAAARLRVFAAPFRGSGPAHAVLVGLHVDGGDLALVPRDGSARGAARVAVVVLDEAGRVVADTRNTIDIAVPPSAIDAVRARGLRYLDRLELPPGRYHVRAGIEMDGGRIGTVHRAVHVPDFAAPRLSLSGLLIASWRPAPGLATGAYFSEWLPGPATAQRRFERDDELTVFGELYHDGQAGACTVLRRVTSEQGEVALEWEETMEAPPSAGPVPLKASLPLVSLAPGRYRLLMEVRSARRPGEVAAGELAFEVVGER